jgi:hypothetical protein
MSTQSFCRAEHTVKRYLTILLHPVGAFVTFNGHLARLIPVYLVYGPFAFVEVQNV